MALKTKPLALSIGLLFAALHLVWVILMQLFGKALIDWKLGLHFVSLDVGVEPFSVLTLVVGLVVAFVVGYVVGALFVYIHNKVA